MANPAAADVLTQHLIKAGNVLEDQIDAEIDRLDKLDESDLEKLRHARLDEMKKAGKQKQEWLTAGHGEYSEITDEKEFFNASKRSDKMVCHFYVSSSPNCQIMDKHLDILAKKHLETRFCRMNAEKTPFLVEKLKIKLMPTVVVIVDGQIVSQIRGFDSLGGRVDFETEILEKRLAEFSAVFSGSALNSAKQQGQQAKSIFGLKQTGANKKVIKDSAKKDDSDTDDDW